MELLLQFDELSLSEGEPFLLTNCSLTFYLRTCFLLFWDTGSACCKETKTVETKMTAIFDTLIANFKSCLQVPEGCTFWNHRCIKPNHNQFVSIRSFRLHKALIFTCPFNKVKEYILECRSVPNSSVLPRPLYLFYFLFALIIVRRGKNVWRSFAVFLMFNGVTMFKDECKLFRMWLMGDEITFFYFVWENDKNFERQRIELTW